MDEILHPTVLADAEDTHTSGRMSARNQRIEVITRGERRRVWTSEQKRSIVTEMLGSDLTPTEVARKYAISSGLLYAWRQQMLGEPIGQMRQSAPSFAQVEMTAVPQQMNEPDRNPPELASSSASAASPRLDGLIEIVLPGGVRVPVDAQVDGRALRRVLGVLESR